jgi:hypothetical protein
MEKKLSTFQKGKIVLKLIEDLKEVPNNKIEGVYGKVMCVDMGTLSSSKEDKIILKIAERAGIPITDHYPERGQVNIAEDLSITLDMRIDNATRKLNGEQRYVGSTREIEFAVSDTLKEATEQFEEKNIPPSGTCNTLIGEIFRAIQRIQYRAFNDGDEYFDPASPSFLSYIFLRSQVDLLNYSQSARNEETGKYGFEFEDEFLVKHSFDGKISDVVEDHLATTANFIKYQIMDLLLSGKIEDKPNVYDSRDCSSLKEERSWY